MSVSMQFVRFLVVGVVNTLFGYGVFAGLVLAGLAPVAALVAAYVLGVMFNFMTTRRFVFARARRASFLRFAGAYVVIYFFNLGLYKLVEGAGAPPLVAQAICLPPVAVFSFLLFKFQVFRDSP